MHEVGATRRQGRPGGVGGGSARHVPTVGPRVQGQMVVLAATVLLWVGGLAPGGDVVPLTPASASTGDPVVAPVRPAVKDVTPTVATRPGEDSRPSAPDVAAPVHVVIPELGVAGPVDGVGLTADGALEVPGDADAVGWYALGAAPGRDGPAVLVGHVDSHRGPGVFAHLIDAQDDDQITITHADGARTRWRIDRVEAHHKDTFPTDAVYGPTGEPQLRLITCGGEFDRASRSYTQNVIVYASLDARLGPTPDDADAPR